MVLVHQHPCLCPQRPGPSDPVFGLLSLQERSIKVKAGKGGGDLAPGCCFDHTAGRRRRGLALCRRQRGAPAICVPSSACSITRVQAVMLSQEFSRALGGNEVGHCTLLPTRLRPLSAQPVGPQPVTLTLLLPQVDTPHILLGLVAEEPQRTGGFLGSGLTGGRAELGLC